MKPSLRTPLALSILTCLRERPMHPYEIKHMMHERRHDDVVKLRMGSLYSTINRLDAEGMIVAIGTEREGRRPERTTYTITAAGEAGLLDWLRDALATPVHEFPQFGSMLAFLPHLMPHEAASLLRTRVANLEAAAIEDEALLGNEFWSRMPRMHRIHAEYAAHLRAAEIAWVSGLADDIETGRLAWPEVIVDWHRQRGSWVDEPGIVTTETLGPADA